MRDDAVLRRALPLGRGLGPEKVTESYPTEFISHVSYSLLLIGIHVIAPLSRLATKRPDWPVLPNPTSEVVMFKAA